MEWKTAGPRKRSRSRISVRKPTLLILVSIRLIKHQDQALITSEPS